MVYFSPEDDSHLIWRVCGRACDRKTVLTTLIVLFCAIGILLMIVLLAVSVKDIDENEIAIPYGQITKHVGEIAETGKRTFPPDTKLYVYDSKFISNVNELSCLSRDGLVVQMNTVTQYSLIRKDLKKIFFEFGAQKNIDDYIDTIVQDTVRDVCATFDGEEFFSRRSDVEVQMANNLTANILASNSYVQPGFMQLRNINLPEQFLKSIQRKQLALEDVDVARNERAQTLIQAETRRQQADLQNQILLNSAQAAAAAIVFDSEQRSNARLLQWAERAKAFIIDLEALEIDALTYLNEYLYVRLRARTLTPIQQACLQTCPPNTACWFCFVSAPPAVVV